MLDVVDPKAEQMIGAPAAPLLSQPKRYSGIAVVGSHPATVTLAPYDRDDFLIYMCSPDNTPGGNGANAAARPRVDQFFENHIPIEDSSRPFGYLKYISELPIVWMRDKKALPFFKGGRLYPEEAMKAKFCPFLFSSSIAYIMAKAIADIEEMVAKGTMGGNGEPPVIGLYGILQQADQERYSNQRPGTQYFIWEATRRGIKVLAARESQLFEPPKDVW